MRPCRPDFPAARVLAQRTGQSKTKFLSPFGCPLENDRDPQLWASLELRDIRRYNPPECPRRKLMLRTMLTSRKMLAPLLILALTAVFAAPSSVFAADPGPDVRAMRINLDGQGILEVDTASSAPLGKPVISTQVEYLSRPLVVRGEQGSGDVLRELVYERLQIGLGGAVRLWKGLTLMGFVPMAAFQNGSNPPLYGDGRGALRQSAIGDVVTAAKYVIRDDNEGIGYGVLVPMTFPTATPNAYMGRESIGVEPTFVVSKRTGHWHVSANVGAALFESRTTFDLTQGSTANVAIGASYNSDAASQGLSRFWFDSQLRYTAPIHGDYSNLNQHSVELHSSLRIPMGRGLFLNVGAGLGVMPGVGVPAIRPFAQLQYKGGDEFRGKLKPLVDPLGVPASGTR